MAVVPVAAAAAVVARGVAGWHAVCGTYVVSNVRNGKFMRLHRIGGCGRKPGIDFACYTVLGMDTPDASMYTAKCKNCFGARGSQFVPHPEMSDSSATSSEP